MGKKAGNKKAKAEIEAEEVPEPEESAAPVPPVGPELPAAAAVAEEVEETEDGEAGDAGDAAAKKKKKKKKKGAGAGAAEGEDGAEEVPAPALAAAAPAPAKAAGAEDDDDEEEGDAGGDAGAAKKKKKKKKKATAPIVGSAVAGDKGVAKYCSDEEFEAWVANTMAATANGTEKMSQEDRMKHPIEFRGYTFSGSLRPAFVAKQIKMPAGTLCPDYATHPEGFCESERIGPKEVPILEGEKLKTMREACRYGREVLDIAARFMRKGVTGDEIDRVVYQACVDRNIYPSPLNYYKFPKCVCVSPNEVICHGIPDSRPIEEGDTVNLDISIYHKGFHSDLNETFFIGECGEEAHRVVQTAYQALHAAASQCKPGTFYRDLGDCIHREAVKTNCAVVTTYCGHGVGELFHGPPKVPHYRKNKAVGIMKPGHVFTVEPMINIGSDGGDKTWPDNWTAVTRNGKRSAQFEHTFLVTETGIEVLTARPGVDRFSMPLYDPAMFQR